MSTVAVGEILWDVFDDARHIGGASFNFSAHLARLGRRVWFVSAVGQDELGRLALERVAELGLDARFIHTVADAPTGTVRVFLKDGQPDFTIVRPAAYDFPSVSDSELDEIAGSGTRWIYFGTVGQGGAQAREVTKRIIAANPHARIFYDINLRKDSFTRPLVEELMMSAYVLKLNDQEVCAVLKMFGDPDMSLENFCGTYSRRFGFGLVCVTRGGEGCAVWSDQGYVEVPGYVVKVADTVGAGDAFSAGLLHGLEEGWTAAASAGFANRLGALVASRPGAIPPWTMDDLMSPRLSGTAGRAAN